MQLLSQSVNILYVTSILIILTTIPIDKQTREEVLGPERVGQDPKRPQADQDSGPSGDGKGYRCAEEPQPPSGGC